jgi:hypothetical protein
MLIVAAVLTNPCDVRYSRPNHLASAYTFYRSTLYKSIRALFGYPVIEIKEDVLVQIKLVGETDLLSQFPTSTRVKTMRKVARKVRKKSQIVVPMAGGYDERGYLGLLILPRDNYTTRMAQGLQEWFSVAHVNHFPHYENGTMFWACNPSGGGPASSIPVHK